MNKKKLIAGLSIIAVFIALTLAWAVPPWGNTVGLTSVKIVAARDIQNTVTYATNTAYIQGTYVQNASKFYMAIDGGTSGTTPPVHWSGDVSDGGIVWRRIPTGKRAGFTVINNSTNTIFLCAGNPAEVDKGIRLNANGGSWGIDDGSFQGAVFAISAAGTNNSVVSQEW